MKFNHHTPLAPSPTPLHLPLAEPAQSVKLRDTAIVHPEFCGVAAGAGATSAGFPAPLKLVLDPGADCALVCLCWPSKCSHKVFGCSLDFFQGKAVLIQQAPTTGPLALPCLALPWIFFKDQRENIGAGRRRPHRSGCKEWRPSCDRARLACWRWLGGAHAKAAHISHVVV